MNHEANETRLLAVDAVALEMMDPNGACVPDDQDEYLAAAWLRIATECRAAPPASTSAPASQSQQSPSPTDQGNEHGND